MQQYDVDCLLHVLIAVCSLLNHFSVSLHQSSECIVSLLYADMLYAVVYMHALRELPAFCVCT